MDTLTDQLGPDELAIGMDEYQPSAGYLDSGYISWPSDHSVEAVQAGRSALSLQMECHSDPSLIVRPSNNSGHLNAFDMNICLNQSALVFGYAAYARGLAVDIGGNGLTRHFRRESSTGVLEPVIANMDFQFRRPINPAAFSLDFQLVKNYARRLNNFWQLQFRFSDSAGGAAVGSYLLVWLGDAVAAHRLTQAEMV
jgi:hypothetical protein